MSVDDDYYRRVVGRCIAQDGLTRRPPCPPAWAADIDLVLTKYIKYKLITKLYSPNTITSYLELHAI